MGYLDEEIVALHSEIVELQRSPLSRKQGDVMEQLSVVLFEEARDRSIDCDVHSVTVSNVSLHREGKAIELYKQLKAKCKSKSKSSYL